MIFPFFLLREKDKSPSKLISFHCGDLRWDTVPGHKELKSILKYHSVLTILLFDCVLMIALMRLNKFFERKFLENKGARKY